MLPISRTGMLLFAPDGRSATADERGFKMLSGFKATGFDIKSFAVEQLGFVLLSHSKGVALITINRELVERPALEAVESLLKKWGIGKALFVEWDMSWYIHEVIGWSAIATRLYGQSELCLSPVGTNLEHHLPLSEGSSTINEALALHREHKGEYGEGWLKALREKPRVWSGSVILDENHRIVHFGYRVNLYLGGFEELDTSKPIVGNAHRDYFEWRMKTVASMYEDNAATINQIHATLSPNTDTSVHLEYQVALLPMTHQGKPMLMTVADPFFNQRTH